MFGKQSLFPVPKEAADDIAAIAFVNKRIPIHEGVPSLFCLMAGNDFHMVR